jgi:trans-aconitate methyltransferase
MGETHTGEAWRDHEVATRFATERAAIVPESRAQIDVLLHVLRQRERPTTRVVDLGSGDAVLLDAVLSAFPGASGLAMDYAETMRDLATQRLARFGPRAVVAPADLRTSGWRATAREADVVISGFAIHHLPDARKREVYAEIFATLSPGGTFLNLEHVASATPVVGAIHDEAMIAFRAGPEGDVAATRATYHARPDKADNILAPVEQQCLWLRDVGFIDVDIFWKWFELALFGGRKPCS